ncbi:hypothetical protein D3C76_1517980 [compost metagenome]
MNDSTNIILPGFLSTILQCFFGIKITPELGSINNRNHRVETGEFRQINAEFLVDIRKRLRNRYRLTYTRGFNQYVVKRTIQRQPLNFFQQILP